MKRTLTLALATLLLIGLLAGCGGGVTTSPATSPNASDTTSPATTEGSQPVTLTMLVSGVTATDGNDVESDIVPKYVNEAYPYITIETTKLPDDQYYTTLKTKLAAGEGPDIFLIFPKTGTAGAIDLAKAGYAKDISDMNFWGNIGAGAINDMSYEGKVRAVAKGLDFLGVYYNKALFAQAGITDEPQNWDEFLADCQALKDQGVTPIVTADKDAWYIQFGLYQIAANVVYPDEMNFDELVQAGSKSLNDPKWVEALDRLFTLYDKGYVVENSLGIGSAQAIQMFIDGQAAMTFDGTWNYSGLTADGAADFERGFMALPANDAGKPVFVSASTAAGYGVNADTKNYDAVKKVFELWFDGKSDLFKAWIAANSSISIYKGVPLNNELYAGAYDLYQNTGNAVYFCNQMWPGGVADEMEAKFQEVIGGQATTQDVADAMKAKFDELWQN